VGKLAAYISPVVENPIMIFTGIYEEFIPTTSLAMKK